MGGIVLAAHIWGLVVDERVEVPVTPWSWDVGNCYSLGCIQMETMGEYRNRVWDCGSLVIVQGARGARGSSQRRLVNNGIFAFVINDVVQIR